MPLRAHEMVYVFKDKQGTYNPQKTEGKPYKATRTSGEVGVYGTKKPSCITENNKGDRHPTSILHIPEAPEDQEQREHEMVYVFSDTNSDDLDNSRNLGLREYAKRVKEYINKTLKEIDKAVGNLGIHHFYSFKSTQFELPTQKTYNKLIEVYELDKMEGFRTLEDLKNEWKKIREPTYNPQKTAGTPYKPNRKTETNVYGTIKLTNDENKGDRHPTTIVKFNNPVKSVHRTQKPTDLCEWLIKSYSNEGDLVLDFTMGSGSTGIACLNTNRKFIGVEKDEEIFKIAEKRINEKK